MGLMDNFKRFVRGDEDYDSEEYRYLNEDEEAEQVESRWSSRRNSSVQSTPSVSSSSADYYNTGIVRDSSSSSPSTSSYRSSNAYSSANGKVVNIHTTTQLSVVLMKPDNYQNVSDIADHLKAKRTVVLNLEETNREVARRILDFLSGAVYAMEGNIRRIANSTYLITPQNIAIQGNIVEELENNGLYV